MLGLIVLGCVLGLAAWAPRLRWPLDRLVRLFAGYVALSFLARAAYLMAVRPTDSSGDELIITTLRPYDSAGMNTALLPVAGGICALLGIIYLGAIGFGVGMSRGRQPSQSARDPLWGCSEEAFCNALLFTYTTALAIRVAPKIGVPVEFLGATAAPLSAICVGLAFISLDWRRSNLARAFVLWAALGELIAAGLLVSKTPLLVVAAFMYLDPRRSRLSWKQLLTAGGVIVTSFAVIQRLKEGVAVSGIQVGALPSEVATSLLERFDGLRAVSGALTSGVGSVVYEGGTLGRALTSLMPGWLLGPEKTLVGSLWGPQVYGTPEGTSYAESVFGEGYVLYGGVGVIVWSGLLGLVFLVVAAGLLRNGIRQFFALGIVGSAALFERGLFGILERVSVSVQAALVMGLMLVVLGRSRVQRSGGGPGSSGLD